MDGHFEMCAFLYGKGNLEAETVVSDLGTPLIPASNRERALDSSSQASSPNLQSIKWVPLSAFVNGPGICHFFFGYGAVFL